MNAALGRLRFLLDIYSPNPISRSTVLATMAIGVYLLGRGVATGTAIGAVPFLLLLWANHQRFLATVEDLLARHAWLVLAVPLAVFVSKFITAPPTASDDLLRHIVSAFWPGGYADMYVYTALPPVELYPTFDWLAGGLGILIGPVRAMWTIQALAVIGFVAVFVLAARRLLDGNLMSAVLALVALLLVLQIMGSRLFLARPEIFMTIWVFAALLVNTGWGIAVWCAAGLALGSGYWLAALYFPAAVLLPFGIRRRFLVFGMMTLSWTAMWWWLTDGRLVQAIAWTLEQVANRVPGITISENTGILNVLLMPQFLLLAIGSTWAASQPGVNNRLLLLAGYFLLSNQARYGGVIAPLFALHALSALARQPLRWPPVSRSVAVAVGAAALSLLSNDVPRYGQLPRFVLPEGAVVLTGLSGASYGTTFANPGRVRVAPAFEIGALAPDLQRIVRDLDQGELDCGALRRFADFTHLIEPSLFGAVRPCLRLEETRQGWRLWRIERAPADPPG